MAESSSLARLFCRSPWDLIPPALLGILAFWACVGWAALDPTSIQWFSHDDDIIQAWLGWSFFRASPWTWPPGLNPAYGLDLGNAIIYTDSIPLLAFIFKLFQSWLPPVFQYQGWWLFACFILQAVFAWKLLKLATRGFWPPLIGTLLFLWAPIFIIRLAGHYTLVGQFMLLAGLYLCLLPHAPGNHYWYGLLALASLTHAYFLFMLAILWGTDLLNRLREHELSWVRLGITCVAGIAVAGFCCWLAGYFAISPGGAGGFGIYKMNLLSPFNAGGISWLIPDIPCNNGEEEGFNYLGTGSLILLAVAIFTIISRKSSLKSLLSRYWPLMAACVLLSLVAFTNVIGFGPYQLELPRPTAWERWLQPVFRASGRFFWPVNYLIVLFSVYILFKYRPYKMAVIILAIAAAFQIADSSKRWWPRETHDYLADLPMASMFWTNLPYDKIRIIPLQNVRPDWKAIGLYAALHGKQTDAIYVSRTDDRRLWKINKENEERIAQLRFDPDTLYILDEATYAKLKNKIPDAMTDIIDGFPILAPQYYTKIKGAK